MFFNIFKKKSAKDLWPENAKYKYRDFVNFRHRGELRFGFVLEAHIDAEGNVVYTLQIGGECPIMIYDYKEANIIGKAN